MNEFLARQIEAEIAERKKLTRMVVLLTVPIIFFVLCAIGR